MGTPVVQATNEYSVTISLLIFRLRTKFNSYLQQVHNQATKKAKAPLFFIAHKPN